MKVAQFIGESGPGGAETIAYTLARMLDDIDIESVVFTTNLKDKTWTEAQVEGSNVKVVELPDELMRLWSVRKIHKFTWRLSRFLKEQKISILHTHMFPQIVRGMVAAKLAGVPHVGTLHDVYSLLDKPSRIRLLKLATVLGTQLVAVSKDMSDTYHRVSKDFLFSKLPEDNPNVIYNGVDDEKFEPCDSLNSVLELVSVGRLQDVKNYPLLIEALFHAINHREADVHLTLIGDGPERERLEHLVSELSMTDHVTFLGARSDVQKLLCEKDVFVLPSKSEGMSCSIQEAMASGLPILATDVGGNRELVDDTNGMLVESGNMNQMSNAIREFKGSPDIDALGRVSRRKIEKEFSIRNMFRKYLSMYYETR